MKIFEWVSSICGGVVNACSGWFSTERWIVPQQMDVRTIQIDQDIMRDFKELEVYHQAQENAQPGCAIMITKIIPVISQKEILKGIEEREKILPSLDFNMDANILKCMLDTRKKESFAVIEKRKEILPLLNFKIDTDKLKCLPDTSNPIQI